jgi:D-2-hydroxyacid dehydrogenase (NADP+)
MKKRSLDTILVTHSNIYRGPRSQARVLEAIRKAAPDAELAIIQNQEEWEQRSSEIASKVEVLVGGGFGWGPASWLHEMPNLRWAQQTGAGANWLSDYPAVAQSELILTNAVGVRAIPIAEHVLGLMFTLTRCIQYSVRRQIKHTWDKWAHTEDMLELNGATMGIIGVGRIGEETAKRAKGIYMRVLGLRRHAERAVPHVDQMYGPDDLMELLSESDWVVLSAALTAETKGLIGENELKAMKKSAYIINVGRGALIQEKVFIKALQEGWIAGAGLDVVEQEPLPDDSPLWDMENVVITPHQSQSSPNGLNRFIELFTENLRRYQAGESLINVVDKQRGY